MHLRHTFSALLILCAFGCQTGAPLLNSERIERQFGSYGVEVLSASGHRRTASLYSGSGDARITRTYAAVEFLGPPRPEYRPEHEAIAAGASIGATFERAGWTIRKQTTFIGALEVPPEYATLGRLMHVDLPATLAVHENLFVVSREGRSWTYARIVEVHHPDYLGVADLERIYGLVVLDDSNRDRIHDFLGPPAGNE